ncbi:MAG TPA: DNA-formamidopyrimidine glycosylase family protein [Planctomycetota bacterium]|nr:DNA-formamidopyrimidine glycosylase family protein [Planctomycetota bacterium]
MPELPDVTVYRERLEALLGGQVLEGVRLRSAFLLRSVQPPLEALHGQVLTAVERLGKRLVFVFEGELLLVLHLMIAGRLRWYARERKLGSKVDLAAFDFAPGTLVLTEAGTRKRASLHVVRGRAALAAFDRGGLEVQGASPEAFAAVLRSENRTLKRALCDPTLFSGIGNAYSDEILHAARLSPVTLTSRVSDAEVERLRAAIVHVLQHWTERLRAEVGDGFPDKVTAFREGMAVHGRYGQPCPDCGAAVQRIRYADNECNYCAQCQCGGRLLADRGLSALLKKDWPRTLAELEERRRGG